MQKLKEEEIQKSLSEIEGWVVDGDSLKKDYGFKGFSTAIQFINLMAPIAEKLNHHPVWTNSYNRVTICLYTQEARGITKLDFKFATEADKIADELRR
ncbi:MAG TPA: 4a-hydroxytetrahydrobiopterin dehydratase [Patescibacteria group bacterium]|nr:4a-hydroxytetrahydrobiopterin dehydratase [Patescibacteria group bacterium]